MHFVLSDRASFSVKHGGKSWREMGENERVASARGNLYGLGGRAGGSLSEFPCLARCHPLGPIGMIVVGRVFKRFERERKE